MAGKKKTRSNINIGGHISMQGGAGRSLAAASNVHMGAASKQATYVSNTPKLRPPTEAISKADADSYAEIVSKGISRKKESKARRLAKKWRKTKSGVQLKSDVESAV